MKLLTIAVAIAVAKKPKFPKSENHDGKERVEKSLDQDLFEKCGQPPGQSESASLRCFDMHFFDDKKGIMCENICPDGTRPGKKNWTNCRPNKKGRLKWTTKLSPCTPMCEEMNFDELNSRGVHYEKDFSRRGSKPDKYPSYKLPVVRFSCLWNNDSDNRLNIKGWFQIFSDLWLLNIES